MENAQQTQAPDRVRAKFRTTEVTRTEHGGRVKDMPVYRTRDVEDENYRFWEATPSGDLELQIVNEVALAFFEPGREFYLDFIRIEDEPEEEGA